MFTEKTEVPCGKSTRISYLRNKLLKINVHVANLETEMWWLNRKLWRYHICFSLLLVSQIALCCVSVTAAGNFHCKLSRGLFLLVKTPVEDFRSFHQTQQHENGDFVAIWCYIVIKKEKREMNEFSQQKCNSLFIIKRVGYRKCCKH